MKKLATIVIVLAMAGLAQAAITVTLDPTDDAVVRGGNPWGDLNNETSAFILYDDVWITSPFKAVHDQGKLHLIYDLSSITDTVLSATLRFTTTSPSTEGSLPMELDVKMHDEADDGAWDEGSITWNNAPTGYNTRWDLCTPQAMSRREIR